MAALWRALGGQPATGRSFLVIIIVASAVSLAVALWSLHSITEGHRVHEAPAGFLR